MERSEAGEGGRIIVAAAQMEPRILDKEANLRACLHLIDRAAGRGARLVVLPECALTGYCFTSLEEALSVAEPIPGPSTEALAARCRQGGLYAVVGLVEEAGERCYNAAVLVGPEGLLGSYRKAHLPRVGLDLFVAPGDREYRVYETGIGRVGLAICYDLYFPESVRALALAGADIVANPTNWPLSADVLPEFMLRARACENRLYIVAANRVGLERGVPFIGRSQIVHLAGRVLAEAGPEAAEIIYASIAPAKARQKHVVVPAAGMEFDPIADRRPDLYGSLVQPWKVPS